MDIRSRTITNRQCHICVFHRRSDERILKRDARNGIGNAWRSRGLVVDERGRQTQTAIWLVLLGNTGEILNY